MKFKINNVTSYFDKEPICVEKFYLIGPVINTINNDFFNIQINNIFEENYFVGDQYCLELINDTSTKFTFYKQLGNDGSVILDEYKTNKNERIFLYSNIYSKSRKKVLISLTIYNIFVKLWINNYIGVIGDDNLNDVYMRKHCYRVVTVVTELKEGNNSIILELARKYEEYGMSISFRVSDYFSEINQVDNGYVNNFVFQNNKIFFIYNKFSNEINENFEFMLVPNDFINIDLKKNPIIKLFDIQRNKIDEFELKYYKKMIYNFKNTISTSPVINFEITIILYSGSVQVEESVIFNRKLSDFIDVAKANYDVVCSNIGFALEDKVNILGRFQNINDEFKIILGKELNLLSRLISGSKDGFHFWDFIKEPGVKAVYFQSILDYKIEKYYISIPNNYNSDRKYPLIIFLCTERYNLFSYNIKNLMNQQVIVADISCRGVTMGSYIGEAAFFESFNLIKKTFSIDEDRVYLVGHSNGAFAAWALAQAHPDIFAGIISNGGAPYKPNLLNIINMGVINYTTDIDSYFDHQKIMLDRLQLIGQIF